MKQLISLTFLLLSISGISQQYSPLKNERLNGKIKSVECYRYYVINKNGEIQKGARDKGSKKFYNELGLIQKELHYSYTFGNSPSETFYYYDTLGRIEKEGDGQFPLYYFYDKGEIITTRDKISISTWERIIPTKAGYDSIKIYTTANPIEHNVTKREFDSQGNLTKESNIIYEVDGTTQKQINWTQSYTNKYDKNNDLIETDIFKEDYHSRSWYISIYYDGINFGTREAKKYEKSGSLNCTITYNKYDKNMNWTKMIKYYNGVAHAIVERIITYY